MRKAINEGEGCFLCNLHYGSVNPNDVHVHEIYFGTGERQISIDYGMCVELCSSHHNMNDKHGVHHNNKIDDFLLKQTGQRIFEKEYLRSDFIKNFGMSYLDITFKEYMRGRDK